MNNRIDHFVIGADDLDQGANYLQTMLGVEIPFGGKHDLMSTHNCMAQAANERFIEVIAIDPNAPDPGRVRWFTLDEAETQTRIKAVPRALCWVAGTDDLDAVMAASPIDLGEVINVTRGERTWRVTTPKDGSLPEQGLFPAFVEWPSGPHPSGGMPDLGIALESINIHHPDPEYFGGLLDALQIRHLVTLDKADERALSFTIKTPNGDLVTID